MKFIDNYASLKFDMQEFLHIHFPDFGIGPRKIQMHGKS